MCRRPDHLPACVAAVLVCVSCATTSGDDLSILLERNGLQDLLVVHLESLWETSDEAERGEIMLRLSGLYAQLLEHAPTPEREAEYEQRGRELLDRAGDEGNEALHFAILRAGYRRAEQACERYRLRLMSREEVETTREGLGRLIMKLDTLSVSALADARRAERALDRLEGRHASDVMRRYEESRSLGRTAGFLAAWARYYEAWLEGGGRSESLLAAETAFAGLLEITPRVGRPEEVSVDLRQEEAFARSILGIALCKSLTSSLTTALDWLDLLDHHLVAAPVRDEAGAWRLVVLLEAGKYRDAAIFLAAARAGSDPDSGEEVPVNWLRLAAVESMEHAHQPGARSLAGMVTARLAARGHLEQIYDLADRYGVDSLGSSGFPRAYIEAVLLYRQARVAHEGDEPPAQESVRGLYRQAASGFELAMTKEGADEHPDARYDCRRLEAWSRYFSGEFLAARALFEVVSQEQHGAAGAESLWMAIVCLDKASSAGLRVVEQELADLIATFLDRYPRSPYAGKLILRRSVGPESITPENVEALLAIPETSRIYDAARQRAEQIVYALFRDAEGSEQVEWGETYLRIALPRHIVEDQQVSENPSIMPRVLVRMRRILEVSLADGIGREVAARTVLASHDRLLHDNDGALDSVRLEFTFRALQLHMLEQQEDEARDAAEEIHAEDPSSRWSRLASRTMLHAGLDRWRTTEAIGGDDRMAVNMVMTYGGRVLEEYGDGEEHPGTLAVRQHVARACMAIWNRSRDHEQGRRSLELYESLLISYPSNRTFLRGVAMLSEPFGRTDRALDCWRTLSIGIAEGGDGWYEAQYHKIRLLMDSEPERGARVFRQYQVLHPGYGPEPWKGLFLELAHRMPPERTGEEDGSG